MKISELINYQSNKIRLKNIKMNRENIVPFVGAGVSKECGLFLWSELLHKISEDYLTKEEVQELEKKGDFLEFAETIVKQAGNPDIIMKRIREVFDERNVTVSETPYILVSSFSNLIITTNYDSILEEVSRISSKGPLKPLLPCLTGQMNEAIQINDRRLLKIHGSLEEVSSFIFTKKQYFTAYGKKGKRDNLFLPNFLDRIYSTKKVLFVGCSLDKDITLEILEESIKKNGNISHYAIVPLPKEPELQIKRKRQLAKLGIEGIYFPEGDYNSISLLLNYLAQESNFASAVNEYLKLFLNQDADDLSLLLSILNKSFYETAVKFPQILDIDLSHKNFFLVLKTELGEHRNQNDTLLNMCLEAFKIYVEKGCLRFEKEIVNQFSEIFSDLILQESQIQKMLKKKWSINRNLSKKITKDDTWIWDLSDKEVNYFSQTLLLKLKYKNGMDFSELRPAYTMAKELIEIASNKIEFHTRLKLMNSIGAFGPYFQDKKSAIEILEKCIEEINKKYENNREFMLLKSKCYNNLAIAKSSSNLSIYSILNDMVNDIKIKRKYKDSNVNLARSLNMYATILKEIDPFSAFDVYLEAAELKQKILETNYSEEYLASWATTIFNLGLLAKDLELYDYAYIIINFANKYRFKTISYSNKDFCSSINIIAELEMFVHQKQNLNYLIKAIESRIDLPEGFTNTLAHTWYVCANYYYIKGDFNVAYKYITMFFEESKIENSFYDFRLSTRSSLLLGDIRVKQADENPIYFKEAEGIYLDIISNIENTYGKDSFYLLAPYRHLYIMYNKKNCDLKVKEYQEKYLYYVNKYKKFNTEIILKFKNFIQEVTKHDCRDLDAL